MSSRDLLCTRALVVFSGRADLPWQRLLKPGFRHCSLIVEDGQDWVLVEPLSGCLQVRKLGKASTNIAARLTAAGLCVVETERRDNPHRAAPPGLWTCVETVKRGLGIHAMRVQTPFQLHKFLQVNRKKGIDKRTFIEYNNPQDATTAPNASR